MPCCSALPGPLRLWEPAARVVLFCVCSDPCGSDHSKCGWCIRGNACLILAGLSQLIMIWDGIPPLDFHLASLHFPPTLWRFALSLLSSLLFCFILSCFMLFLVSDFGLSHLFHFLCFHGGLHLKSRAVATTYFTADDSQKAFSHPHLSAWLKTCIHSGPGRASPDWLKGTSQTWCVKYSIYLSTHTLYQLGLCLQGSFSFSLQNMHVSLLN